MGRWWREGRRPGTEFSQSTKLGFASGRGRARSGLQCLLDRKQERAGAESWKAKRGWETLEITTTGAGEVRSGYTGESRGNKLSKWGRGAGF